MWVVARSLFVVLLAASPAGTSAPLPQAPISEAASAEALAHYARGRMAEEAGNDEEALGEYYRVLTLDPGATAAALKVSEISARLGQPARSLEFAEKALRMDSTEARAQWLRGSALFNLDRGSEALSSLEAAVRADSSRIEYWRTLARVAERLDRLDIVANACRGALEIDDSDGDVWFQLAAAEARLGRFGAADTALDQASALLPDRPGSLFLRGWIREAAGRPDEAVALYRRHLAMHPTDLDTRRRLVRLLHQTGHTEDAWHEAHRVTEALPGDLEAIEAEAELAYAAGQPAAGAALIARLRRPADPEPEGAARAAGVLARNGKKVEAVEVAADWARHHPADYRGAILEAQIRLQTGDGDGAVGAGRRAVGMAPDSLAPRAALARIEQDLKRWGDAAQVWQEAHERFPQRSGVVLDMAFCREQNGEYEVAVTAVRDLLVREPDNPEALNFLGYVFADHNRNLDEARRLIEKALAQEPDNGAFLDSMGWVSYRQGRLTDARRNLERAVELSGDPVVHEHLGDVYKDLNLLDLARAQYQMSLGRDSLNTRVQSKLRAIR